ncbi:MAG: hypothetical protein LBI79_02020 [Nitrososphaerota archaeon]|nr:hypothetical protein [Nitrososphaerota archaeon]
MKNIYLAIIVALLAGLLVGLCCGVTSFQPRPNPEVMEIVNIQRIYTMQWNEADTTLTFVGRNGTTVLYLTTGQWFTCNGTTSIYENDRLIFQLP